MPEKWGNWAIAGLLLAHVTLGLAFNVTTPIFEAPDEDGHYLFVRYLQVYRALPVQQLDALGPRAHHPPLYHALVALLTAWVPVRGGAERIDMVVNPNVWFRYDDPATDNKNYWVHTGPDERFPFAGQALVIHLGRGLSLAFSALGVWLTCLAARELRPGAAGRRLGLLAGALVAFHPMVLFMSAVVQNNTTMLAAGGSIAYLLLLGLRRGFSLRLWTLAGILLGVGVLLQLSSLALALPVALALLYWAWRAPGAPARRLLALGMGGLAVVLPLLALTGWWFWRNRGLYGDWTGNNVVAELWCCDPIRPLAALKLFLTGLLGRFGQGLMITYPVPVYAAAAGVALVAVAGLARPLWLGRGEHRALPAGLPVPAGGLRTALAVPVPLPAFAAWRGRASLAWLSPGAAMWLVHAATAAAVCAALGVYALTVIPGVPGRYLFPAFPSLAALLAAGWLAWVPPAHAHRARLEMLAGALLAGLLLAAALYGLLGLLRPTYAMPRTPSAAELAAITPLEADLGAGTARMLGYKLSASRVAPGEKLGVTLYWQPLTRTDVPYTVFLHLLAPGAGSLAQRDTYPGGGNYATTGWDEGRVIADPYWLLVPASAPAADNVRLVFGLYNAETGERLPVVGANAGTADERWVVVGEVAVGP